MSSLGQIWDAMLPQIQDLGVYKKYQHVFEELEAEISLKDTSEEFLVYQKLKTISKPLYSKQIKEDHMHVINLIELIIRHVKLYVHSDTVWISDNDMNIATIFGTESLGKTLFAKHVIKIFEEYRNSGDIQSFLDTVVSRTRNIGVWCKNPTDLECNLNERLWNVEVYSMLEKYTKKYVCLMAPVCVKDIIVLIVQLGINQDDFEIDCAKITETSMAIEVFNCVSETEM